MRNKLEIERRLILLKFKKLKEQAVQSLSNISKDEHRYKELITNLIAQTLFRLIEKEVYIKCREKDVHLVNVRVFYSKHVYLFYWKNVFLFLKHAIEAAVQLYKDKIKRDVRVSVLTTYLPPDM